MAANGATGSAVPVRQAVAAAASAGGGTAAGACGSGKRAVIVGAGKLLDVWWVLLDFSGSRYALAAAVLLLTPSGCFAAVGWHPECCCLSRISLTSSTTLHNLHNLHCCW